MFNFSSFSPHYSEAKTRFSFQLKQRLNVRLIELLHSRGQQLSKFVRTKDSFYLTKEDELPKDWFEELFGCSNYNSINNVKCAMKGVLQKLMFNMVLSRTGPQRPKCCKLVYLKSNCGQYAIKGKKGRSLQVYGKKKINHHLSVF